MSKLAQRKTRLIFETGEMVRYRGKLREVIVCAETFGGYVRLKGTKQRLPFSYAALYDHSAKLYANQLRAEKQTKKRR